MACELPAPSLTPDTDPDWATQYEREWEHPAPTAVWTSPSGWWVQVGEDGEINGGAVPGEPSEDLWGVTAGTLREIAGMFLAAAEWKERLDR